MYSSILPLDIVCLKYTKTRSDEIATEGLCTRQGVVLVQHYFARQKLTKSWLVTPYLY